VGGLHPEAVAEAHETAYSEILVWTQRHSARPFSSRRILRLTIERASMVDFEVGKEHPDRPGECLAAIFEAEHAYYLCTLTKGGRMSADTIYAESVLSSVPFETDYSSAAPA
jgi:hypothetical protein